MSNLEFLQMFFTVMGLMLMVGIIVYVAFMVWQSWPMIRMAIAAKRDTARLQKLFTDADGIDNPAAKVDPARLSAFDDRIRGLTRQLYSGVINADQLGLEIESAISEARDGEPPTAEELASIPVTVARIVSQGHSMANIPGTSRTARRQMSKAQRAHKNADR